MAATALDHLSLGGRIDWLAQLDTEYHPEKNYRRTSIVRRNTRRQQESFG